MTLLPGNRPDAAEREATQRNLPATVGSRALSTGEAEERAAQSWRQPLGVALLPIAIAAFLVIAFAMALWTFLTATT